MNYKLLLALFCSWWLGKAAFTQSLPSALGMAVLKMEADSTMKHAILSLYVVDAATGAVVFDKNSQVGLAPASCQKLFTSAAALDMLGPDYRYKTSLGYSGKIEKGVLKGNLYMLGSGDPTLGSWRYDSTKETTLFHRWIAAIQKAGIRKFEGDILVDDSHWETQVLPGGWIWEDIGNYYGAGSWGVNWHENQYDLRIQPGAAEGDAAQVIAPAEELEIMNRADLVRTGAPGSGDRASIFLSPYSPFALVGGTVPLQKEAFVISGSIPVPPRYAGILFGEALTKEGIAQHPKDVKMSLEFQLDKTVMGQPDRVIDTYFSPRLDSINYWFLKRSINLYGEALIKTIAYEKTGKGSTEKGVELVRNFWSGHGIELSAIHMVDGSGLSPQNRVTTDALVKVLLYAKTRPWYSAFYSALPEFNGMKMKSGSIGGARSFAGYQVSTDGKEYVFSIIVNNYDGSSAEVIKKIYQVLNILKGAVSK
ncbi:MAG TPA: D-alanyl-D-alanine carboxypeptidase/D-alanyl-D-alanine-endopeptidase [Puia sp.]|nr:D-alanyl-D-alanine carboxypeptidase/D-alanyl-D-alanine-endopeptidase [Puia sp.]